MNVPLQSQFFFDFPINRRNLVRFLCVVAFLDLEERIAQFSAE